MDIDWESFDIIPSLVERGLRKLAEVEGEIPLERLEISLESLTLSAESYRDINKCFLSVLERHNKLRHLKAPPFARPDDLVSGLRNLDRLQSLSVTFERSEVLSSFVEAFGAQDPDIRVLELAHGVPWTMDMPWSIPDSLFCFRNLTSISIKIYGRSSPSQILSSWRLPDVRRMSGAWPQLESLTLYLLGFIPLGDLETFQDADLFPNLKTLVLPINCVAAPSPSFQLQLRLRSLLSLETFTIKLRKNTTERDIPALIKYASRIGTPKTRIGLGGHVAGCMCDLCWRLSECRRQELKPLVVSSKTIKGFMALTS
ncbi:hypothetical protein FRC01_011292 [Tulasnella sp. 417]|nr:hypothetical protein FRC01_011292 [Tulasnella sp. 417]